jgi:aldose 1-epimerase
MQEISQFTLKNKQGMQVTLLDFGARVSSILLPVNDKLTEMILGYDNSADYLQDEFYLGASVGRVCNRIANAEFCLNEQIYKLSQNNNSHCLHGGKQGFDSRFWRVNDSNIGINQIEFSLLSEDGDQGFPGELCASVRYELSDENQLLIHFEAITDKDTIVNICNHCYFNLGEHTIDSLSLQMNSNSYLPTGDGDIPTGEIRAVVNSDFCFTQSSAIGARINQATSKQVIKANNGFDHCYLLTHNNDPLTKPKAILTGQTTGVRLDVFTDQIGMQLYTGQYLSGQFRPYQGVCLEAQSLPNAINEGKFGSVTLSKAQRSSKTVIYQFSLEIKQP